MAWRPRQLIAVGLTALVLVGVGLLAQSAGRPPDASAPAGHTPDIVVVLTAWPSPTGTRTPTPTIVFQYAPTRTPTPSPMPTSTPDPPYVLLRVPVLHATPRADRYLSYTFDQYTQRPGGTERDICQSMEVFADGTLLYADPCRDEAQTLYVMPTDALSRVQGLISGARPDVIFRYFHVDVFGQADQPPFYAIRLQIFGGGTHVLTATEQEEMLEIVEDLADSAHEWHGADLPAP